MSDSNLIECDVAIIGGGPAGSTVGALLKRYSPELDVAILEKERFPREHVGESQLPAISPILDEMGAWDKVEAALFPIKIGGTYRWGSTAEPWDLSFLPGREFVNEPRPAAFVGQRLETAFQVDRSIYDKILLDHAASMGCWVFEENRVLKVETDGDRVVSLKTSNGEVRARHFVDASGDSGILRRALNVEVEEPTALRNIAIWDYWRDAEWAVTLGTGGTLIQVMSLSWGWLWFIPITETRTSVGLVLPAAYFKASGKTKEQIYHEAIASEPLISKLLSNAKPEGKLQGAKDWSFVSSRLAGENWFLVGDACGFADPILSAGMTLAHTSGRKVAYSILELDRGELEAEWIQKEYSQVHRDQILHHVMFADYWYSANGRFTDLAEYCSEIALKAGVRLNPDEAFAWLATGGFALEEPGAARALSYRVGGVKYITQKLGGTMAEWEITKTNIWVLKIAGASEGQFACYRSGRIVPIKCYRKGDRLLPVVGVYHHVLAALRDNVDAVKVVDSASATLASEGLAREVAVPLIGEAIEALIAEGWVKTKVYEQGEFVAIY